jgi:hypothetical protein
MGRPEKPAGKNRPVADPPGFLCQDDKNSLGHLFGQKWIPHLP